MPREKFRKNSRSGHVQLKQHKTNKQKQVCIKIETYIGKNRDQDLQQLLEKEREKKLWITCKGNG